MTELTDEDVMKPAPQPAAEMSDAQVMQPERVSSAAMPTVKSAVEPILDAMGQGFREGWGPERMGIPDEDAKALSKIGIFAPEGAGYSNPFHAFNELLAETIWRGGEIAVRGSNALFRSAQAGVAATGEALGQPQLGRELAAIPEAFLGSPHPTGTFRAPTRAEFIGHAEGLPIAETAEGSKPPLDLGEARGLGAIGPEPKPIADSTPQQAAEAAVPKPRTMAAERTGDDVIRSNPARDKAGNIRLDQIGINADAKDVILKAAEDNNDFQEARQGDVPLSQVQSLSEATGIPAKELQANEGLGRLMHNDAVVRTWLQAFHQASDEIAGKMKEVALTGDEKSVEELREMKLRFSHMQEQVSGLTAEAGRTLAVFKEFYESKGKAEALGKVLEDNPGNDVESLKKLAKAGSELDRGQLPKFLADSRKPGFWDKAIFYWVNQLISGPITHAKYVLANGAFAGYEAGVVTPLAAVFGTVRKVVGSETAGDRVLHGEAAARIWGLIAGTPDAVVAAYRAAKTGMQTPLPGELAQNIVPKQNKNVFFQQTPIPGTVGKIVSIPSRGASAIHSFFNFLGYRASMEQQAYRAAVKEGLSPTDDGFWQRRGSIASNPTKEMMDASIEEGYRLTFISELGPGMKKVSQAVNALPPLRLLMPFVHIPFNILKAAANNTALAVFDKTARDDMMGRNGTAKQDTALARVVAGSAVGAWMVNNVLNDRATGYGPTDPKERALWLLSHQPYSVRIGDNWVSYNRFGPLGTLMGLYANFAEAAPHFQWDGEEMTKAAAMLVHSTGRILEDEVGMQGLAGMIDAINEPERKGVRFISSFAASWAPASSAQRQVAAFMDPHMRETKTFLDGLKYQTPGLREELYPRRDWSGTPVPNPAYHSMLRTAAVPDDPVVRELQALNIRPAPPQDRIHGVKLTPGVYDEYQSTAGPFVQQTLRSMIDNPRWHDLPPFVREQAVLATIKSTREMAAAAIQAKHPAIIYQAMQDRIDHMNGATPKKKLVEPAAP